MKKSGIYAKFKITL